ncbi:MAG: UDP-4-amino-4,6-dideoxy-N-acetyl-beta-L-altrosamine transaminase, partial [Thalassolituus sp.]
MPYGTQGISPADVESVVKALGSDFLTQGPVVEQFERELAKKVKSEFCVSFNSGTSALHIACVALGLSEGDWLWTSPISFVASANCGRYCGAKIDFVDIDLSTANISVDALEQKLIAAEKKGCLPKLLVVVHMAGMPCDMEAIHSLSLKYQFFIIEDASHALGAKYKGDYVGNCRFSDITVFSFHPVKIITTGEGGALVTKSQKIADKARLFRSHGVTRDTALMNSETHGLWYYQQIDLGYNYRLTDIQSALGLSQLVRLDEFVAKRHMLSDRYNALLSGSGLGLPEGQVGKYSALHLYILRVSKKRCGISREGLYKVLSSVGIGVNVHYIPIHIQPYYAEMGFTAMDFPNAICYY